MNDTYSHGHHESVLRSHTWRTAENSAAYLLPHLQPGQRVLDIGCGPGTITADLARRVSPGSVVGMDASGDVIQQAAELDVDIPHLSFRVGDAYATGEADASADVVHAHQVLQHLSDPVAALTEWRRVLRPGGLLAVRDSDYAGFVWAPNDPLLDRWLELYHQLARANRAESDAGRHLLAWGRAAGYSDLTFTSSTWTFADAASRAWWGDLWAERIVSSAFAEQVIDYGLSDADELTLLSTAFRQWSIAPDATFIVVHGELLARA